MKIYYLRILAVVAGAIALGIMLLIAIVAVYAGFRKASDFAVANVKVDAFLSSILENEVGGLGSDPPGAFREGGSGSSWWRVQKEDGYFVAVHEKWPSSSPAILSYYLVNRDRFLEDRLYTIETPEGLFFFLRRTTKKETNQVLSVQNDL